MIGQAATPDMFIDEIAGVLARQGATAYLGEAVSVAEHLLQAAALAQAKDAPEALVAAALLHDIGQFTSELGEYSPHDQIDNRHDQAGARVLSPWFPPIVAECVGHHVAAKRYLCATDPLYHDRLSEASKHSLALQGGAMGAADIAAFTALPFHREAVRLRLWDDRAKAVDAATPSFDDFRPLLRRVMKETP